MANLPVPYRDRSLAVRGPALPAVRTPGAISYTDAGAVGFEVMPAAVTAALAGLLLGPPLAADAGDPVARRQADGTCYQQVTGWWAGGDRYLSIDARRLLAPARGQALRPVSGWKITGTVSYYAPGTVPGRSRWRFQHASPPGRTGPRPAVRETEHPLEVLPEALTVPVRGAPATAWQTRGKGWAEETIVAALAANGRVRVLHAHRTAASPNKLPLADWQAVTIDAAVTAVQQYGTDAAGRVLLGPRTAPPPPAAGAPGDGTIAPR